MAFHSGLIASLVHSPIKLCFFVFLLFTFERTIWDSCLSIALLLLYSHGTRAACFELSPNHLCEAENHLCKADEERRSSSCGWERDRWTADCQASVNIWCAWTQLCCNFCTCLLNFTAILVHLHLTQFLFLVNWVVKQFYPWQQSAVYFSVSCVPLLTKVLQNSM